MTSTSMRPAGPVPLPTRPAIFLGVCALAGALAVPLSPYGTPLAALVVGLVAWLGLRLWSWSHLILLCRTGPDQNHVRPFASVVWILAGLLVGVALLSAIRLLIEPSVPSIGARIAAAGASPYWRRAVVIFVAAVSEELIFRLVLLSVFAGVLVRFARPAEAPPGSSVVWSANVLAALAFAAVHIPSWGTVGSMGLGLVAAVMVLNALGGIAFGYVFVTRGIVAAIWAHAGADCVIQFLGPLTG